MVTKLEINFVKMRILIIGGTGLISTPITRALLQRGDEVTLFNRGQSSRKAQVPEGAPDGSARILHGDRRDFERFETQMRAEKPFDCVIDMVAYQPEDAHSAVRAFAARCAQFIFCSTVDVYAKPASRYPTRDDEPYGALNDYGRKKVVIETVLREAHERGDFALTILRPAHTYDDGGALIHGFGGGVWSERLREGRPIIVHGDGTSLWSQAHAEDVGAAFVAAAGNAQTFGQSYTVTNEEAHPWTWLYQIAAQQMNAPEPSFVFIPTRNLQQLAPDWAVNVADNFSGHNIFDCSAAKRDLGYRTTIDFRAGARRVLARMNTQPDTNHQNSNARYDRIVQKWDQWSQMLSEVA